MVEFARPGEQESIKIEYEKTEETEAQLKADGWEEITSWHKKLVDQEKFVNNEALRYKKGGYRVVGVRCDNNPYSDDIIWALYKKKDDVVTEEKAETEQI